MANKWTAADIPSQGGKTAVVTGANSGLVAKGEATAQQIHAAIAGASIEVSKLDLGDLASVHEFAERLSAEEDHLDLLVNTAGVMAPPRRTTVDGFESQFGTNHFGHFALTGLLLGQLLKARAPRVVTLSSEMHRSGGSPTQLRVPDLPGGSFVGPDGFLEQRGYPHLVTGAGRAYDQQARRRPWEVSEELTGVRCSFDGSA